MSNPISRLRSDIQRLHQRQQAERTRRHELGHDGKVLGNQKNELKKDSKELKHDKRVGDSRHKVLDQDNKSLQKQKASLQKVVEAKAQRVGELEAKRAGIEAQWQATVDPNDPASQGDPALFEQLQQATAARDDAAMRFDGKIADTQTGVDQARGKVDRMKAAILRSRAAIKQDRVEIGQDRKQIAHQTKVVKTDHKQLDAAHTRTHNARRTALNHLRPAEYKMGLKQTNKYRKELGLKAVDHVIRPMNLSTVRGCAQFLLKSPNVSFWTGLSTGSDRKNLELLAAGKSAFVPATGGHVVPKLAMMQALCAMAKQGHIMINALTGGHHSTGSNHYSGTAVDLDLSTGNSGMIESIARRFGGLRNFETDHIHLDF